MYAGQAGATKWPSGSRSKATLASRVGGNHLRGNIGASTFRRTLAAALRVPLRLDVETRRRLTADSNRRLSDWIRDHMHVACVPVDDADTLGRLEEEVLARLDPPLNLSGTSSTPLRTRLTELRIELQ